MGDSKLIANPVVILREEFDDWAVLFNPDTAEAVGINPVGVTVWRLLDGSHDLATIVAEVERQFFDLPENLETELERFVAGLVERGFAAPGGREA